MRKEILCTLGPASVNERVITRLESLGVNLFRINLSHTKLEDLPGVIKEIQKHTRVPICLDTEGAQVRTGNFASKEVSVKENSIVFIHRNSVPGDAYNFNFYPNCVFDELVPGDFISIDFNSVLVQVIDIEKKRIAMRVLNGGKIGQNKAVSVERDIPLPVLTAKDREALKIGAELGIRHVALSFANRASDVAEIRAAASGNAFIISKIETRNSLLNLDEIAKASDALLIDRGDLSRQEPIERIPKLQKNIIARGKEAGKKIYVATNLLESMVTSNRPTRAEVNDVYNTLLDGADGLVLAAETAIGKNPIGCANMIVKLIHEFENAASEKPYFYYPEDPCSLLVEPHGGFLVHREIDSSQEVEFSKLHHVPVDDMTLMECAQIAFGTYSPLTGFMNRETLQSVIDTYRLPCGDVWPMPIVLQIEESKAKRLSRGQRVVLTSAQGTAHALLDINDIYTMALDELAQKWFKTN
ncbi:MAG TPA: pyruvate kinase, partial [bacterium]|nr:pyruvate kinase [bacterium]